MTLETAKRIIEEGQPNKEAEAVVRGGMTICENQENGSRKYKWIKVSPTKTDNESSIELAMKIYQKKKQPRSKKDERTKTVIEAGNHPVQTTIENLQGQEPETKRTYTFSKSSTIACLRRKINEFMKVLDGLVEE